MAHAPYPLILQSLISLVLLATLPSALTETNGALSPRFALLCLLAGLHILACWLVPVQQLGFWRQLVYLALQVGVASAAHVVAPSQMLGYVYLVIVLQAVYLFKPLRWIIFAGVVYGIWSGALMVASASLLDWSYENLALAFPVFCILIAAALYARQHQRHEQVQEVLQQQQSRYEALLLLLRDVQQRAAIEERHRLAQTIASDITAALAQIEQSIASTIAQAQTNLARIEPPVAQTRAAAAAALDRMRAAVATLRLGAREDRTPESQPPPTLPPDELMTVRSQRTLTWALPLAFATIALPLTLLQGAVTPLLVLLFMICCATLIGGYVFTQRIHNPLLVRLGLAGQAAAVLGMVFVTQALPLTLGLLLVLWQMAMRLPVGQLVTFLVGVPTLLGLALPRILPIPVVDTTNLLAFCVACVAVGGLVGTARRLLSRRQAAGMHLAQLANLSGELELQVAQARALAVAVERTRLAREIHDDIGHRLVLLNIQLQLVDDLIEEDPAAALEQLCSTREQLREAWLGVIETADAVLALDGATLFPALDRLVEHCRALTSIQITLKVSGDLSGIDRAMACAIYRATQEGLTNVCKYAQAQQAHVFVYGGEGAVQVRVRNDGCGVAEAQAPSAICGSGQFGLTGLRERAELLGGDVEAGPLPDGGFALIMTIPLQ